MAEVNAEASDYMKVNGWREKSIINHLSKLDELVGRLVKKDRMSEQ